MKCGYVEIEKISEDNFHNLLSEFHLRPIKFQKISEEDFDREVLDVFSEVEEMANLTERFRKEVTGK